MRFFIMAVAIQCISGMAWAKEDHEGPCKKLRESCEAAGFAKGEHKNGKGLIRDCLEPLLTGQTVQGVAAAAADLESCRAHRMKHMKNFKK